MFRRWLSTHKSLAVTATSVIARDGCSCSRSPPVSNGYTAQHLDLNDGSVWVSNGGRPGHRPREHPGARTEHRRRQFRHRAERGAGRQRRCCSSTRATARSTSSTRRHPRSPTACRCPRRTPSYSSPAGNGSLSTPAARASCGSCRSARSRSSTRESQPTLSLGADSVVSVTPEGMLFAYSRESHQVHRLDIAQSDTADPDQPGQRFRRRAQHRSAITSVGDHWALFDATARKLLVNGHTR